MMASATSASSDDLNACPILKIIRDGDESTNYMKGSNIALINMGTLLMNDILFGTTVINMIYEI